MSASTTVQDSQVLTQNIIGARRPSNYFWAVIAMIGGVGFLLAGLSSYFQVNLLIVSDPTDLQFVPQGIALTFYGVAGSLVSTYLWLVAFWDVGGGYNQFDKNTNQVKIFRWGYPGKNRRIELVNKLSDVEAVKAEIKEGLNPTRALYLRVKGRRNIPLTRVGEPLPLSELENRGAELARFLGVPLEGI